jgi:hypothetical protein
LDRGGLIGGFRQSEERIESETENARDLTQKGLMEFAGFQDQDFGDCGAGLGREHLVVDGKPTLGLADDVCEAVFERDV